MAGGGLTKHNNNKWGFHSYKGNNLGYEMLCQSVNSGQEEKERDLRNGNRIIKLKNLITNIDFFCVQRMCTGEGSTYIIRRGKRRGKLH